MGALGDLVGIELCGAGVDEGLQSSLGADRGREHRQLGTIVGQVRPPGGQRIKGSIDHGHQLAVGKVAVLLHDIHATDRL